MSLSDLQKKEIYDEEVLVRDKWVRKSIESEELQDVYKSTFKIFEYEKRIPVKATVIGRRLHYGYKFLPNFLKFIDKDVVELACISFNFGIGKHKTLSVSYPFKRNLARSWYEFELKELPLYLENIK